MKFKKVILIVIGIILTGCTSGNQEMLTGGATETVNARVILHDTTIFVSLQSHRTVGAVVKIFQSDYNPVYKKGFIDSIRIIGKDTTVRFNVHKGIYNVMICDYEKNSGVTMMGIKTDSLVTDTINDTLSKNSLIKGIVRVPQNVNIGSQSVFVYITGTSFEQNLKDTNYIFSSVPGGTYTIEALISNVSAGIKGTLDLSVSQNVKVERDSSITSVNLLFSN